MFKKNLTLGLLTFGLLCGSLATANAEDVRLLKDMERERAILVDNMISPNLSVSEKESRLSFSKRRLADLERMVLRDDALVGANDPIVRKAFKSYDLTFLVHAAAENKRHIMTHWLEQMDISTASLMTTHKGRR